MIVMMPSSPSRTYACGSHGSAFGANSASADSRRRAPNVLATTSKPPMPSSFMKSRRCASSTPVSVAATSTGSFGAVIHGNLCLALIA